VTALLADCASFVVSLVCVARIRDYDRTVRVRDRERLRRLVDDGVRFIGRDPLIRPLTLFGGLANLALVGYQSLLVVFLVRTIGVGAGRVGLLLALSSCGAVVGAFVGNPLARRLGSGRALLLTKVCACPFALLIPLAEPGLRELLVPLGGFVVGLGIVAGNVINSSFAQQYIPPELFSRTSGTTNVFNYGTIPLGALIAGTLASALGVRAAMWFMTALLPLTALILIASPLRRLRQLPTARAPQPDSLRRDPEPADPTRRRAHAAAAQRPVRAADHGRG
jgi:predicted MFS family arabinose efflux permease